MRVLLVWTILIGSAVLSGRSARAGEPAPLAPLPAASAAQNQALADVVAAGLRRSGVLRSYRVDVSAQSGVVELTGTVTDAAQRDEVLRLVHGIPSVEGVVDHMRTTGAASGVVTAQGPELPKAADPLPPPIPEADVPGVPPAPKANGPIADPVPLARMAPPAFAELTPPSKPPYAWPNYAPYNNFSRCAIPQAYPAPAFPFIGPVYPYPKVPLGWRSVKLEWDDGYWWFSKVGNKYNWWKIRYW